MRFWIRNLIILSLGFFVFKKKKFDNIKNGVKSGWDNLWKVGIVNLNVFKDRVGS